MYVIVCFSLIKKMSEEIINYFRLNLKKKLARPNCGRFLSHCDNDKWKKHHNNITLDYIQSNDFLILLYQTKCDLCCVKNINAYNLSNAIDKFFFLLLEFERYYSIFISNDIYKNRIEIIDAVIRFYRYNYFPQRLRYQYRYIELFKDLIKKINEWNYWKRLIIINYTKVILTDCSYQYAQEVAEEFLQNLIKNIEKIFDKGIENV